MILHHIVDENGKSDSHWYADMLVSDDMTIKNILIDTGASISTLNIKSLSRIYEKSEKDVREYLLASGITDKIVQHTATNDCVELYGVFLRNIKIDDSVFPVFKVYTRLDGYVSNLIGMDVLSACQTGLKYTDEGIVDLDMDRYKPNTTGSAELKNLTVTE